MHEIDEFMADLAELKKKEGELGTRAEVEADIRAIIRRQADALEEEEMRQLKSESNLLTFSLIAVALAVITLFSSLG